MVMILILIGAIRLIESINVIGFLVNKLELQEIWDPSS